MARSSGYETLPFLDDEHSELAKYDHQLPTDKPLSSSSVRGRRSWCVVLIYVCLTILNGLWFLANVYHSRQTLPMTITGQLTSVEPRDAPIEVVKTRWDLPAGKRSAFTSYNRDEADAAWSTRSVGNNRTLPVNPILRGAWETYV
ncbi:uncharacterized protein LY79DRAFT_585146 [Colletotrichum navitas]|uniref:Uncharacterized protein n=1 Tax=Colletotrichum navitas TaxID=681940 RepID=A0AAD8PJE2_9PEZI|nr:uncharacterized protein LY79DRAFT_585146 [Colletotrichum navitas]KAK1565920.1 hypothetical protein LY79DRAFT_585146 [Colletotrichum navitas]